MSWIEKARKRAKQAEDLAREEQKQKEEKAWAFAAEEVSVESLAEYMAPYLVPVEEIRQELADAGFIVSPIEYEFITLGEVKGMGDPTPRKYSLSRISGSSQEYSFTKFNDAYGAIFSVTSPKDRYTHLSVSVLPRTNDVTHYAGVEYRVSAISLSHSELVLSDSAAQMDLAKASLVAVISQWIEKNNY